MDSRQKERLRIHSTEEVFAFHDVHGKDDYSSSEASSNEWQSGDTDLDDSHVAKRLKLASLTPTKDSHLQQVSSNSEISRTRNNYCRQ